MRAYSSICEIEVDCKIADRVTAARVGLAAGDRAVTSTAENVRRRHQDMRIIKLICIGREVGSKPARWCADRER